MDVFSIDTLFITPEMLNLIAELDKFKGTWQGLGILAPGRLSELKKVAMIESIDSWTRKEGALLSDTQIKVLLSHLDNRSFHSLDEQEVAGYAFVCEQINQHYASIPLSENST